MDFSQQLKSLNSLVWGIYRSHLQVTVREQSVSNAVVDVFPRLSHTSGAKAGGARNEMMKTVVLRLILLEEKNASDGSLVLFLMITSLPSQRIRLQGGAAPALQYEDSSGSSVCIKPAFHHTATFFPKGGSYLVNGKVKRFPEK